ncbi:RNase P modulator RnpM [Lapidilactobacillus gannanensis]|uniref:RNase P modulator RnpM n=1 Tax=Lapidilactobacillus gannanensis TaxID=2486002 RepID=A0ABW4BP39_9LACO|nr:YlxR family protein [Lapidilactobacillus gannanensis]MCH4058037.1 YlxR family protein [Lactobacillaceae bacterium]
MKKRKIPMRRDILTNEMRPKKALVRIVRNSDGEISLDPTGKKPGRGAYVSLDPVAVEQAKAKHLLDKTFGQRIDAEFYDELYAYVDHQKARQELFGDQG